MQPIPTKNRSRRQLVSSSRSSKADTAGITSSRSSKAAETAGLATSVKRLLKDQGIKERAVRFRSTDEEYVFDLEQFDDTVLPDGSDIFQRILKDMKGCTENEIVSVEDDDVFDGIFTATTTVCRPEKKSDSKKPLVPRKSILKRRSSSRR